MTAPTRDAVIARIQAITGRVEQMRATLTNPAMLEILTKTARARIEAARQMLGPQLPTTQADEMRLIMSANHMLDLAETAMTTIEGLARTYGPTVKP